ncbi:hypothetical protein [Neisseria animalis]|uniref:hypothetical protein n=1 Tax=Neisseria animalis TaxID=492 RepID=UPI000F51281B|nr:hypothetical protein [Neisseria animalis]
MMATIGRILRIGMQAVIRLRRFLKFAWRNFAVSVWRIPIQTIGSISEHHLQTAYSRKAVCKYTI